MTPDELRAFIVSECRRLTDQLPALREQVTAAEAQLAATTGAIQAYQVMLRKLPEPSKPTEPAATNE